MSFHSIMNFVVRKSQIILHCDGCCCTYLLTYSMMQNPSSEAN